MKKHLNTLFVTSQGAYLAKEGETVVVRVEGATRLQVPVHTLGGIVCFGNVSISPYLMAFCSERDVSISFLSDRGRFLAKVQGPVSGNVLLRREQYRKADDRKFSAAIARSVLSAKIANSRTVLQRALRDHGDKIAAEDVKRSVLRLGHCLKDIEQTEDLETMRGLEGDAAKIYFGVFDHLIVAQKESFTFRDRNRRPPLDNVNCLLSLIYTLLMHDVRSALETVGIDPAVGFLHRDRPGRPGCALDLMEEFRPFIADRLTLSLINLKKVSASDFRKSEAGAVTMSDDARKMLISSYQERKREEIIHPYTAEKMTIGLLYHLQALLLARHLRGELDGYPPFIWK